MDWRPDCGLWVSRGVVRNPVTCLTAPLVRHIVLVLVVVLVLERVCWVFGLELFLCAKSELHPASAGLGVFSGADFALRITQD